MVGGIDASSLGKDEIKKVLKFVEDNNVHQVVKDQERRSIKKKPLPLVPPPIPIRNRKKAPVNEDKQNVAPPPPPPPPPGPLPLQAAQQVDEERRKIPAPKPTPVLSPENKLNIENFDPSKLKKPDLRPRAPSPEKKDDIVDQMRKALDLIRIAVDGEETEKTTEESYWSDEEAEKNTKES